MTVRILLGHTTSNSRTSYEQSKQGIQLDQKSEEGKDRDPSFKTNRRSKLIMWVS
jgi:hypothetical protein